MRALVLIAGLLLVYLLLRWLAGQPKRVQWRYATSTVAIVLVLLVATGRVPWLFALLGALLPVARRLLSLVRYIPLLRQLTGISGAAQARHSTVETEYLRVRRNPHTGAMSGKVLRGEFQGRPLRQLNREQLLKLLEACTANDPASAALLKTYLESTHGKAWRESQQRTPPETGTMSRGEAYQILGLSSDATPKDIVEAHRRLIQRLHPDRGGSHYLATKLNQAKAILTSMSL